MLHGDPFGSDGGGSDGGGSDGGESSDRIANARALSRELDWLSAVIAWRFAAYGGETGAQDDPVPPHPPDLRHPGGPFHALVTELLLGPAERLVLALALAPTLAPQRLDPFLIQNQATGRRFSEFGGLTGRAHAGFLPTVETALFLLAGTDDTRRIALEPLFWHEHPLIRCGLLILDHSEPGEPPTTAALRPSPSCLHRVLRGANYAPPPGSHFPASPITTPLDWSDLVLDDATMRQIESIRLWMRHGATLMEVWGLDRRLKPGYRCLFYGPPGTGKTLTAALLGKQHGRPVYRIDLSQLISKWIGETEKNLAALFDQAEGRDWILFFDEADVLFGKRTEAESANDRAANQQVAYLLQRLEGYAGLAIVATNLHTHIDPAFARRFQAAIRFPLPDAGSRLRIWRDCFTGQEFTLAADVDFGALAERFELTGGAIINVLRHACLKAVRRQPPVIEQFDLLEGIKLELYKDGRSFGG